MNERKRLESEIAKLLAEYVVLIVREEIVKHGHVTTAAVKAKIALNRIKNAAIKEAEENAGRLH